MGRLPCAHEQFLEQGPLEVTDERHAGRHAESDVFFTKDADTEKVTPLLKGARRALGAYGIELDVWPSETPNRHTVFESWDKTIDDFDRQGHLLRNAIAKQYPVLIHLRLPVFFCWMGSNLGLHGVTLPSPSVAGFPPFVLIDTRKPLTATRSTIAHEIGHAADLLHNNTSPANLMYERGDLRTGTSLTDYEVGKIKSAYFKKF